MDDPPCIVSVQFGLLIGDWWFHFFRLQGRTQLTTVMLFRGSWNRSMGLSRNRGCTLTGVLDNLLYVYVISIRRKNYIHLFIHPFALIYTHLHTLVGSNSEQPCINVNFNVVNIWYLLVRSKTSLNMCQFSPFYIATVDGCELPHHQTDGRHPIIG